MPKLHDRSSGLVMTRCVVIELRSNTCPQLALIYGSYPERFCWTPLSPTPSLNSSNFQFVNSLSFDHPEDMPPASRNSSISSASTSSSRYSDMKKKFNCNFPACGKSFSRSEHLHRHALNHKEGTNTCLRCSAHFRRRDLLGRFQLSNDSWN